MDILLCAHNKIIPLCICAVQLALNLVVVVMPWFELVGVVLCLFKAKVYRTLASFWYCQLLSRVRIFCIWLAHKGVSH